MREKVVVAKKDCFKVLGIEYDYYTSDIIKKYKKIKIIVLEQDMFTSYILENKSRNLEKTVEENVITMFNGDEDCLVHYEEVEGDKHLIYSLKGGRRVEALCRRANSFKVVPVQFMIFNNIRKRIKEKEFSFLYYLDKGIYYIKIEGNKVVKSTFNNSISIILSLIDKEKPLYYYEDEKIQAELLEEYNIFKLRKKRGDLRFEKILS